MGGQTLTTTERGEHEDGSKLHENSATEIKERCTVTLITESLINSSSANNSNSDIEYFASPKLNDA